MSTTLRPSIALSTATIALNTLRGFELTVIDADQNTYGLITHENGTRVLALASVRNHVSDSWSAALLQPPLLRVREMAKTFSATPAVIHLATMPGASSILLFVTLDDLEAAAKEGTWAKPKTGARAGIQISYTITGANSRAALLADPRVSAATFDIIPNREPFSENR